MTKDKLVAEMNEAMQIVGYVNSWTQPISTRVMMQDTGIQTPVGIKVKGPDLAVVEEIAQQVEGLLSDFPGTQAVIAERISRGLLRGRAARPRADGRSSGVTVDEAMPTVRFAIGGDNVVGIRQAGQDDRAAGDSVLARIHRHAGEGAEHAGHHRRRPRRCRSATSPTSPCAKRRR